jgi:hypothetical protein
MVSISFADVQENVSGNFNPPDTSTAMQMYNADFDTVGSVFTTVGEVKQVAFVCPSWSDNVGCLTVTLWKWDTDYKTTTKGTPVSGPFEFEDFEDNSILGFEYEEGNYLPAGSYYMELSDARDDAGSGVGVWSLGVNYPGQAVLRDGELVNKLCLRMYVEYVVEPEGVPYGELPAIEKAPDELGGTDTLPAATYFKMSELDLSMLDDMSSGYMTWEVNEDGTLHLTVSEGSFDAQYSMNFAQVFSLDTDELEDIECALYPYMAIRLKLADISEPQGSGECFMYTTSISGATGGYSTIISYDWTNPDWQTVVIDPTANNSFKNNALNGDVWLGFRFDALNNSATVDTEMDIDYIAFFQSEEAALAFDGDFSKVQAANPTKAPTEVPTEAPATEAPVVTDAPAVTDAPVVTDAPAVTDAPEVTDAPVVTEKTDNKTDDKKDGKSNTGLIIGIVVAAVAVAAIVAGIVIAKGKKK